MYIVAKDEEIIATYEVVPAVDFLPEGAKIYKFNGVLKKETVEQSDGFGVEDELDMEMPGMVEERYVLPPLEMMEEVSAVELHIYKYYPEKKQFQDEKWTTYFRTLLVAQGITDVEGKVVGFMQAFFFGSSIEEVLSAVNIELRDAYEKLTKIAIRTHWAFLCIEEYKKANLEQREPSYIAFPKL